MNDVRASGYKVTEQILNIYTNYKNYVNFQILQNTAELIQQTDCLSMLYVASIILMLSVDPMFVITVSNSLNDFM